MDERVILLNAHEETKPLSLATQYETDPSLLQPRKGFLLELVGARSEDPFVFTSSGAEAISQVIWSVFHTRARKEGKTHFIVSSLEESATLKAMERVEELGCTLHQIPFDEKGKIDLAALREVISPKTALISVSMASGMSGVIQPFEEMTQIAKENKVLIHLNANYAVGKIPLSFQEMGADYLSFSGEKIHAPLGTGALFAQKGAPLLPLIEGGHGLRGGPFDLPRFLSLGIAAQQSLLFLDQMVLEVSRLRTEFEESLIRAIPGAHIFFRDELRLPNTTLIGFPGAHFEALSFLLQGKVKGSIGTKEEGFTRDLKGPLAECAMSFALSRMTHREELQLASQIIQETVHTLAKISEGVFDGAE